jgi:hypothetical protein
MLTSEFDSELHDAPRDASLDTSLNPALDPLVLNPCRRSQLFRAAWATAPIGCGWSRGILWGGGVRLVIYEKREKGLGEAEGGRRGGGKGLFYLVCQQKKRSCVSEANFAQNLEAQRSIYLLFIDLTILADLVNISPLNDNDRESKASKSHLPSLELDTN